MMLKRESYLLIGRKLSRMLTTDTKKLRNSQLKAVEYIKQKKRSWLLLDMGFGKTIVTLTAIKQLIEEQKLRRALIIAPLMVANTVWHKEIANWGHLAGLTYSINTGNEASRLSNLAKNDNLYIINRENIPWLFKQKAIKRFGMIVVDESSSFKNPSAKRFKDLKEFYCNFIVLLSGTPCPNGELDLWSQIYLLDRGKRLGSSFEKYKNTFFTSDYMGHNFKCKDPKAIYQQISDIVLRMEAEDYTELPELMHIVTQVELPNYKQYKTLENDFILQVQQGEIVAVNAAVLAGKLLQFCNGAIYDTDKNIIELNNAKLDMLESMIEDNAGENIIVAYNFKSDLIRLQKRFKHAVTMDSAGKQVEDWNKGKISLLLCHPASASKGLNLQFGGRIIIWFGITWSLEDYLQFNKRLHRRGQTKPVIINHIVAKDCIDEKIVNIILPAKNLTQNNLFEGLKNAH